MDWLIFSVMQVGILFAVASFVGLYILVMLYYAIWTLLSKAAQYGWAQTVIGTKKVSTVYNTWRTQDYGSVPEPVVSTRKAAMQ